MMGSLGAACAAKNRKHRRQRGHRGLLHEFLVKRKTTLADGRSKSI
jgi:hypothetical protein